MAALAGLVGAAATGCSADEAIHLGWPQGITEQADHMRSLWLGSLIAALVVGVLVEGLILWPTVFHRARGRTDIPRQLQYNNPLEWAYTIVPLIIVAVLFYFTVVTGNFVTKKVADPALRVDVTGQQWNWQFSYPEKMATDGRAITTVGTSTTVPLLVVPVGRLIEYRLRSNDVIHSFWVPDFLFKRDVFPNPEKNNTDNVFQNTIDRQGAFVGRCAELCGTYHSMMNFEVRALPPDLFDQYLAIRGQADPATGAPYSAGAALAKLNCGELCSPTSTSTAPFPGKRNADAFTRSGNGG